jgi:tRNA nucleotidyltransferase (CCA-adding enzyme)
MERVGHEGYPVVRQGRVIGLLTNQAVNRAKCHHLHNKPVADVMRAGEAWVSPSDSIETLQALMAEHGWGQMPVVEDGQVIGVVTRTDLIKLWSAPAERPGAARRITSRLEQTLSPAALALVRRISETAASMGHSIYFVGGLVRDLLLNLPIVDIDLVIEGDAIALARNLCRQFGGRVRSHGRFGTAKWLIDPASAQKLAAQLSPQGAGAQNSGELPTAIDFVTARTEFYTHPTALPQVERSSIKQDLHRRDFTINTLAIQLDPHRFGELLDFYGGETDLRQGVIRVLHSLSFIEDPTRILRAARLEARLGFRTEPRTEQLIAGALSMLDRVSGDRIRHELVLIFQEARPEQALYRLQELGALEIISPGLHCDRWLRTRFESLRRAATDPLWSPNAEQRTFAYLALLLYRLPDEQVHAFRKRLKLSHDDVQRLAQVRRIKQHLYELEQEQADSALYRWLSPYSSEALLVVWCAAGETVRRQIRRFQAELRDVRVLLGGQDLIERYGLKPGPVFRRIFDRLRDARLDGLVHTRQDEEELLEQLLSEMDLS